MAVPLAWAELEDPELTPGRWTVRNIGERLRRKDPWAGEETRGRSVRAADRRLSARL